MTPAAAPAPQRAGATAPLQVRNENDYEDLLSLWSDLETGLGLVLSHPRQVQEFVPRVMQYQRWMQDLIAQDTDVGLYLLFQLSSNSSVGYSASHALTCGVLCHLIAGALQLPDAEHDSLVRAALTMNIGMTALQDQLALQAEKLTPAQQTAVNAHATEGRTLLQALGVTDPVWLTVVDVHHAQDTDPRMQAAQAPVSRLAHVLQVVDRYAAMISPRKSRAGRSAADSVRSIMNGNAYDDEIGHALIRVIGPCPPGTYVRLDDGALAVVMRRGPAPDTPDVAIIGDSEGQMQARPRLHATSQRRPRVQTTLPSATLGLRLNHHRILQLTAADQHTD